MSGSFDSPHNPLPTLYHFFPIVFPPLFTTTIGPVAMTSVKKSPLLTPAGPLF